MDSEAPDIMFICSMVDYCIHAYIEAVRCIFISKICFCVSMVQIVGACCVLKIKSDIFVLESDVSANYRYLWCFYSTRLKGFLSAQGSHLLLLLANRIYL